MPIAGSKREISMFLEPANAIWINCTQNRKGNGSLERIQMGKQAFSSFGYFNWHIRVSYAFTICSASSHKGKQAKENKTKPHPHSQSHEKGISAKFSKNFKIPYERIYQEAICMQLPFHSWNKETAAGDEGPYFIRFLFLTSLIFQRGLNIVWIPGTGARDIAYHFPVPKWVSPTSELSPGYELAGLYPAS